MIVGPCIQLRLPVNSRSLIWGPNQHVGARDWLTQSDLLSKLANIESVATSVRSDLLLLLEPFGCSNNKKTYLNIK
jgi:hypothetical protein